MPPRHGPATGTCPGIATASIESGPALHLHRAPPRWHPLQQLPFVHVRPAPAMMRLHRDLSYLFLLSPPPSLMYCTCSSINNNEHRISRPSQRGIPSSLFFSSTISPRLTAEEKRGCQLYPPATKLVVSLLGSHGRLSAPIPSSSSSSAVFTYDAIASSLRSSPTPSPSPLTRPTMQ